MAPQLVIKKTFFEIDMAEAGQPDQSPMYAPARGRASTDPTCLGTVADADEVFWCEVPSSPQGSNSIAEGSPAYLMRRRSRTSITSARRCSLSTVPEKRPSLALRLDDALKQGSDSSTGSEAPEISDDECSSECWEGEEEPAMERFNSVTTYALDNETWPLQRSPAPMSPPPGLPCSAGCTPDIQHDLLRSWQLLCAAHNAQPPPRAEVSAAAAEGKCPRVPGDHTAQHQAKPNNVLQASDAVNTTLMLRNLPNNYTRKMFLDLLDRHGFRGAYDLVYLPVDFNTGAGLGYAFVNLAYPADVPRFWATFEGFKQWRMPSEKVCAITWSRPHQGLEAHVERYRNSPVMHPSVPEGWKPALFFHGCQTLFPPPTKPIRPPTIRAKLV